MRCEVAVASPTLPHDFRGLDTCVMLCLGGAIEMSSAPHTITLQPHYFCTVLPFRCHMIRITRMGDYVVMKRLCCGVDWGAYRGAREMYADVDDEYVAACEGDDEMGAIRAVALIMNGHWRCHDFDMSSDIPYAHRNPP